MLGHVIKGRHRRGRVAAAGPDGADGPEEDAVAPDLAPITQARSPLRSPGYDRWAGELDLSRFVPNATDVALRTEVEHWHHLGPAEMAAVRRSLNRRDVNDLLTFARRAAVCSLDPEGSDWVVAGALALSVVSCDRIDWRDVTMAAGLTAWAIRATGQDHTVILGAAAAPAEPQVQEILARFVADPPADPHEWGYTVIETPAGRALAQAGYETYRPTVDLVAGAITIADALEEDHYLADQMTVGSGLPEIWLEGPDQAAGESAMAAALACVSVTGTARPDFDPAPPSQVVLAILAELPSAADAEAVTRAARSARRGHARVALHRGRVCCLAIARSFVPSVEPVEDQASVERFVQPFTRALHLIAAS